MKVIEKHSNSVRGWVVGGVGVRSQAEENRRRQLIISTVIPRLVGHLPSYSYFGTSSSRKFTRFSCTQSRAYCGGILTEQPLYRQVVQYIYCMKTPPLSLPPSKHLKGT